MNVIIFIIILAILILVHEFGHFIVAKKSGIKVSEFGLGFPPKLWGIQKGETLYSINAIPFGGFVKIFGEDPDEESISGPDSGRSIVNKPRYIQAAVLIAGVTFNVIFAWLLISSGYVVGLPAPTDYSGPGIVENPHLIITGVTPGSPAAIAGVKTGDTVVGVSSGKLTTKTLAPDVISNFVEAQGHNHITLNVDRGTQPLTFDLVPAQGVIAGKLAIGIGMDSIGTLHLPFYLAFWEGAKTTWQTLVATATGLLAFIGTAFQGHADLSQITGPVGIVGLVGDVTHLGFVYLISFTAIISLNLAVINILPFPALDGGRLVIVAIEAIIRKPINPKISNRLNQIGFALLIALMVVVTVHDVWKLF
jgi:regulator of sigma E protease